MNPELLKSYKRLLKFSFRYYFFLFEWDSEKKCYMVTGLKWKLMLYVAKCIFYLIYFLFQTTNIQLGFLRGEREYFTSSVVIDLSWVFLSSISVWYHWVFLLQRRSYLSGLNAFLREGFLKEVKMDEEGWSIKASKMMMEKYIMVWPGVGCGNTGLLSTLFLVSSHKSRYMFSVLPEWAQREFWVFCVFYFIEAYVLSTPFILFLYTIIKALIYSMMTVEKVYEIRESLERIKLDVSIPKRLKDKVMNDCLEEYHRIRVLNRWYNSEYSSTFSAHAIGILMLGHIIVNYSVLRLHHILPIPTISMFLFWSLSLFPFNGALLLIMADVASVSDKLIVGAVTVGITSHVYNDLFTAEKFYLGMTSVALAISCILFIMSMMDVWGDNFSKFDSLLHALLAMLLFIGAVLMSVSVSDHWNSLITASNWRTKRALSPTLGFVNVLLYVILAFRILNK